MLLKETIRAIVQLQRGELERRDLGITREALSEIDSKSSHAIILSGIRRCGKSTLLRQLMEKQDKQWYYLNFEDPRLVNFSLADFEKLEQVFEEEWGKSNDFFFDEIQNIPHWERYIRQLLDAGKKVAITGSNASLLSRELGTKLTGRHLTYEIFPFSYTEMLQFTKKKEKIASFQEYFERGGFPEFLRYHNVTMLQELLEDILTRDIIVRHGLKESKTIKELAIYLLTNSGKEFSYNQLAKVFLAGSTNTIVSYISHLEDSYLLFTITKFDYSYKKQLINPKKAYAVDVGLARANSLSFSSDAGRILENIVYLHLRRKYKTIHYYRKSKECDFIIVERGKPTHAIQVCYELTEENKERELAGLREAMSDLKINGTIITYNQEDKLGEIKVIPAWKWMS